AGGGAEGAEGGGRGGGGPCPRAAACRGRRCPGAACPTWCARPGRAATGPRRARSCAAPARLRGALEARRLTHWCFPARSPCIPARLRGAIEAPPSLLARRWRSSLVSPGGAAPLRLAHRRSSHLGPRGVSSTVIPAAASPSLIASAAA